MVFYIFVLSRKYLLFCKKKCVFCFVIKKKCCKFAYYCENMLYLGIIENKFSFCSRFATFLQSLYTYIIRKINVVNL